MAAAVPECAERRDVGPGVLVLAGIVVLRAGGGMFHRCSSHAEDAGLESPERWVWVFWSAAGDDRGSAADPRSARARERHLLVLREGRNVYVTLHLVPRHIPAVSIRSNDEDWLV